MSTKDTDRRWPGPASAPATEPGGPPDMTTQPRPFVRESAGENAAAIVLPPHRPPRANEKTMKNEPAVVINQTEPLARPVSPMSPEPPVVAPSPAPVAAAAAGARAYPRPRHQQETTVASARVRERNKTFALLLTIIGAGILAAVGIIGLGLLRARQEPEVLVPQGLEPVSTTTTATAATAATAAAEAPRPPDTAAQAAPTITAPPPPTVATAAPPPTPPVPSAAAPRATSSTVKHDVPQSPF